MFDWLGKGTSIDKLIARGQYARAATLIRAELRDGPKSARLLQKLAEVLVLTGENEKAVAVYHHLVDDFANSGFFAKAIAIAKKIQRIDPENSVIDAQLNSLIQTRDCEEATSRAIKAKSLKPIIGDSDDDVDVDIVIDTEGFLDSDSEVSSGGSVFERAPLFQDMSPDQVMAVVSGLRLTTLDPGQIVVSEGQPGDSMFLLASGVVRVYVRAADGANREVRSIDQGDFFGEISLLTGVCRSATITAATPCELLELTRDDLVAIARQHPHVTSIIEAFCVQRSGSEEETVARTGNSES